MKRTRAAAAHSSTAKHETTQLGGRKKTRKVTQVISLLDSDSDDSWGESAFTSQAALPKKIVKRVVKHEEKPVQVGPDVQLWIDRHAPTRTEDLAVHAKKVTEVREWLTRTLASKHPGLLVLTGPTGVGKSATLRCLAKELDCDISEWIVPPQDDWNTVSRQWDMPGGRDVLQYKSVMTRFDEFLKRSGRYQTLFGNDDNQNHTKSRIVLVKDLPCNPTMERKGRDNGYTRVLDEFHDIMRQYVSAAIGAPVVFIVSEASAGSGGGSAVHRLFPPDTFAPPACSQIQFNAVNMTLMKRVLALICKHEKLDLDKSTVEKWAEAGGGDIRNAVSMLQFGTVVSKTRGDASKVSAKRGAKKIRGKADKDEHSNNEQFDPTSAGVCGKDDTIFLLHAAGKVLHNKRTILVKHSAEYKKFDKRLPKQNQRFDLKYDPEELVQKVRTSGLKFRLLLHENCVPFFNDMDSMVEASEYQSDADILDHWQHPLQQELATLVSVRGLSYSRPGTDAKGPGWMPLHGTKWYDIARAETQNLETALSFMQPSPHHATSMLGYGVRRDDFLLHGLTYVDEICKSPEYESLLNLGHAQFLTRMSTWSGQSIRPRARKHTISSTGTINLDDDGPGRSITLSIADAQSDILDSIEQFD